MKNYDICKYYAQYQKYYDCKILHNMIHLVQLIESVGYKVVIYILLNNILSNNFVHVGI